MQEKSCQDCEFWHKWTGIFCHKILSLASLKTSIYLLKWNYGKYKVGMNFFKLWLKFRGGNLENFPIIPEGWSRRNRDTEWKPTELIIFPTISLKKSCSLCFINLTAFWFLYSLKFFKENLASLTDRFFKLFLNSIWLCKHLWITKHAGLDPARCRKSCNILSRWMDVAETQIWPTLPCMDVKESSYFYLFSSKLWLDLPSFFNSHIYLFIYLFKNF